MNIRWSFLLLLVLGRVVVAEAQFSNSSLNTLSLDDAVSLAIATDPWLSGSRYREDALAKESISVATLPDPKVSLMAANFPTDSFDINQEPMTQLSMGVSQMFPRGDSRALSSRQKQELAAQEPLLRQDRQDKVAATVTQLWLEAFRAQESIRLIEQDRTLFEHLVDATKASYSSALGRARQQDIIRAQLELTRLDDRLTMLQQQMESAQQRLSEWIGAKARQPLTPTLSDQLDLESGLTTTEAGKERWLYEQIQQHPLLLAFDQRIEAMQTGVELAQQKYKPEWGVTAQYGYRDDDPMGRDRADLFSVGVTFDLPLFTGNRQDKEVGAATSRTEALRTDKLLMARKLMAELETSIVRLKRLNERRRLYDQQLLPQMAEQAEAALAAYNNDDGDFAEAVRARIAELNAKIDFLSIKTERLKVIAQLNYLLPSIPSRLNSDNTEGLKP